MELINLSKKQFATLTKIDLPNEVSNQEGILYHLDNVAYKYKRQNLIFKDLYITTGEIFANKLHTVTMLHDYEKQINIPELVIPKYLVSVNNEIRGIALSKIEDTKNLGILLHDKEVSTEEKLKYLEKIGNLITKVSSLSNYGLVFYFNDLHEYNFLYKESDKSIYAVDLDSATFSDKYPLPSRYVCANPNLSMIKNKYHCNQYGIGFPSRDCDLLSYNMMVLNTISGTEVSKMQIEDYYQYIGYLQELGFGPDIINSFISIYNTNETQNSVEFFNQIPLEKLDSAKIYVYNKSRNKNNN